MKLILNIGLDVQATRQIAAHVALEIVKANRFIVHSSKVIESDTEPTLVVEVSEDPVAFGNSRHGAVRCIARDLQQEVIACWKPERNKGVMLGATIDLDDSWGAFNPAAFIMPDGRRLSQHLGA